MNLSVVYIPMTLSLSLPGMTRAQVAGVPTFARFPLFSKGAIALDGGLTGGNSGALGTAATTLVGPWVAVSAAGSTVLPAGGHSFSSYGVSADVSVLHLGVAHWDSAGASHLHVPVGLTVPLAWCLYSERAWVLWVGGRRDFQRVAPRLQTAYWDDAWAYTVGLSLDVSRRLGFQLAGDRSSRGTRDWSVSAGVHLALRTLPKGTRTMYFSGDSSDRPCNSIPGEMAGH